MVDRSFLEPDTIDLLESGCALIVGLVTANGAPFATRGWGLTLADARADARARLLVTAADVVALGHPDGALAGASVAVTGCHILTLRSIQLKGSIASVEPPTAIDQDRVDQYCDDYFGAVAQVDNIPRHLMERMRPRSVVAVVFGIEQVYDQTPGPGAGAAVSVGGR
ncbi:MAG: uncharacterized protein JWM12_1075 [Ilumatobacteraceae bacterium]|nr:uncharacterized protein [Ilumatobacteraceae bacterium]